jgi:hypothetical protein
MDAIERRVAWTAIAVALSLGLAGRGSYSDHVGGWIVFFDIVAFVSLGAAVALLVAAVMPAAVRPLLLEQRERLAFFAVVLWALAVLVTLGLNADAIVDAFRHPTTFP